MRSSIERPSRTANFEGRVTRKWRWSEPSQMHLGIINAAWRYRPVKAKVVLECSSPDFLWQKGRNKNGSETQKELAAVSDDPR